MKKLIAFSVLVCACGTWSNEDIVYLYSLPEKDVLRSQLGETASTSQGIRRDPLLGADAGFYGETKAQSDQFNTFIDGVLGGLDLLRTIPPTKREENKRIWGPYEDQANAGFQSKVEIVKVSEKRFEWSLQARKGATGEFTTFAGGTFVPTVSLKKGRGKFFLDAVAHHKVYEKMKKTPTDPDRIDFGYSTDSDPVIVEIDFDIGGTTQTLDYDYNRYADESGVLTYTASGLADPNATKISALAAWDSSTAGEIVYTILEGNYRTAQARVCWDKNQKIVYETGNWPDAGTAGNVSDCAFEMTPDLKPLPPFP